MFHDPSRRKEGVNLKEKRKRKVRKCHKKVAALLWCGSLLICACLPFIEGGGSFLSQHGESTADGALVLAVWRIHEPRFDDIHRGSHYCCAEAGTKGSSEVARQVVYRRKEAESNASTVFGCIRNFLQFLQYCLCFNTAPVIRSYFRMSSLIMS